MMDFQHFQARAHEIFESIPPEYREGVDGLQVERAAVEHPSLPEIFTLGECRSEYYPSDYGGPGEVLSIVVLFYGSFQELARRQEDFDWEGELWETITHEVRHHLESLAAEDALEVQDYVEDQNFARREGEPFDPFFFRSGEPVGDRMYEVDGDLFMELAITRQEFAEMGDVRVRLKGGEWTAPRPERLGDVHFVRLALLTGRTNEPAGEDVEPAERLDGTDGEEGEIYAVLVRKRGALEWLRGILGGDSLEVLQTDGTEPHPA